MADKLKGRYKLTDVITERIAFVGTVDEIAREFNCKVNRVYSCYTTAGLLNGRYEVDKEFDEFSTVRRCRKCGRVKPLSEFTKKNAKYTCKDCLNKYNREYIARKFAKDKDYYKKRNHKYRKKAD